MRPAEVAASPKSPACGLPFRGEFLFLMRLPNFHKEPPAGVFSLWITKMEPKPEPEPKPGLQQRAIEPNSHN